MTEIEDALKRLDYSYLYQWLKNGNNVDCLLPNTLLSPLQDILWTGFDNKKDKLKATKMANLLLDYNASIHFPNHNDSEQPLFFAVEQEFEEIAERLLKKGASPNLTSRPDFSYTPLFTAVEIENVRLVKILAEYSSEETLHQSCGHWVYQPLGLAMSFVNIDIIRILLEVGCNPYAEDDDRGQNIERLPDDISAEDRNSINNLLLESGYKTTVPSNA